MRMFGLQSKPIGSGHAHGDPVGGQQSDHDHATAHGRDYLAPVDIRGRDVLKDPGDMTTEEAERELLKLHQEDPANPLMFWIAVIATFLLLLALFGSSWVKGTFADGAGSFATIEMSLFSFQGDFVCKEGSARGDNVFNFYNDTELQELDCHAGIAKWKIGWSETKKAWCCSKHHFGCEGEDAFDCLENLAGAGTNWPEAKKTWCCEAEQLGCVDESGSHRVAMPIVKDDEQNLAMPTAKDDDQNLAMPSATPAAPDSSELDAGGVWIFARDGEPLLAGAALVQKAMEVENLFCGKASHTVNGSLWMWDAVEASEEISHDAFWSLRMYWRTRFIIIVLFVWMDCLMVLGIISMFRYLYTNPAKRLRTRAAGLFSISPFIGVAALAAWCLLNPGLQQLGFALGGSDQKYILHSMTPLGWCFFLAALTLIFFKLFAIGLTVRFTRSTDRERQLENMLYERKADHRLANTRTLHYGATGDPDSQFNTTVTSTRSESV